MKKLGIIIIVLGILLAIFSGINFKREETLFELGDVELTHEKEESVNWPQWLGLASIAGGVVILLVGRKK
jgi:hypothetical protein